ncbi:MAG TPA: DUF6644 family protein [Vicinamibacterales bacterium]|nr:DUF6644 family protein [Vicinamibacterales bacterium]
MTILEVCQLIENSQIGTSIRESNNYWMLNGAHVLSLAMSVGAIFWFDLRAMGVNMRHVRVSEVYRQISGWMYGGFVTMFITGVLLFWAHAATSYMNIYFRIKFLAMGLAVLNAMYFNVKTARGIAAWDANPVPPPGVRIAGIFSIVMWAGVIAAGRLMAYTF